MLEHLLSVYCSTHVPRHHLSFVSVNVTDKEYPKGTCLAPSFFIVGEREVIALFLKDKTKLSLLFKTNIEKKQRSMVLFFNLSLYNFFE